MYVKKKINRSGTTSVIVSEKIRGRYQQLTTIGISSDPKEIEDLVVQGKKWIRKEELRRRPEFDFDGVETKERQEELDRANQFISQIDNIILNGTQLILDKVFESVGFNQITDDLFRKLIVSRLSFPASKAATVEYLKNHFDEDLDLSKIYRYLDRLNSTMQEEVQDISVKHTMKLFGGNIGVMF